MSSILSLFTTMTTGIPFPEPAPVVSGEQQATAKKRPADVYIDFDGVQVPDTTTVNRWAIAIESRFPVEVRPITSVGHPTNTYGCWVFEKYKQTALGDRKEGKHERLRYADALQMREIYEALNDGRSRKFWELVEGVDVDGNPLPGPLRKDRPPIDAKGNPIEEVPSRGDYGPLTAECEWIENHDQTFVEYMGTDEQWPNGCWQVEKSGCETQYLDATGIKYVAHNLLGMPVGISKAEVLRRRQEARQQAQANGAGSITSLFTPQPVAQTPANGIASLFVQPTTTPEPAPTGIAALFK